MSSQDIIQPEWDFFDRIEQLELNATDNKKLAVLSFYLSFTHIASSSPKDARIYKDTILKGLKQSGVKLSTQLLEVIENIMMLVCEVAEKKNMT